MGQKKWLLQWWIKDGEAVPKIVRFNIGLISNIDRAIHSPPPGPGVEDKLSLNNSVGVESCDLSLLLGFVTSFY